MNLTYRPTRDLDLLAFGSSQAEDLKNIFSELCSINVEPDGLNFLSETILVETIREEALYGGLRIKLRATLGSARIPLCIDIGFGDAVTPQAEIIEFPGLLDFPRPRIQSYSVYTVVAEKLDAMIRLGEINSRLKDFYDVWFFKSTL